MGGCWRGASVTLDGVAPSRIVCVCVPLLIFSCTIKSRSSLLAPAHPGVPGKRAVKWLWCGGYGEVTGKKNMVCSFLWHTANGDGGHG